MAIFNEMLAARYSQFMQKLFGMKGGAAVRQIAGEITPAISFFSGAENRFLESWQRFGFRNQPAAVAAQNCAVRLRNPAGSNVVAVVDSIIVFNQGALTDNPVLTIQAGAAELGSGPNGAAAIDPRGIKSATCINSFGAVAAIAGFVIGGASFAASQQAQFICSSIQEIVLLPNMALTVWSNIQNQAITVCMNFRERLLEESERQ